MFYVEIAYFEEEGIVLGCMSSETTVSELCVKMGISTENYIVGVDGLAVPLEHRITASCRIELYPPLQINPMERRKRIVEIKRKRKK